MITQGACQLPLFSVPIRKDKELRDKGLGGGKIRGCEIFQRGNTICQNVERSVNLFINPFIYCGPRESEHAGGDGLVVL
jgi:hypothetical protein